ncbi:hypothetical protein ABH935_009231 [Catenulispora sp. GAS73]|uniref:spherulation-specific family 4 protein n=1 Tax=Catenulispora sp. GAS73 TaxID=3156269 RepID=UPI0035164C99
MRRILWRPRTRILAVAVTLCMAALGLPGAAAANTATVQHIAVPAYFNPNGTPGSTFWTQLNQSTPAVGIAIANPNSGPGSAFDQGYANAIQAATNAGVHVIGYVDTGYFGTTGRTTRDGQTTTDAWTAQAEADVNSWYSWYGSYGLAGIFFDDGLADCGTNNAHVSLYEAINTFTKQNYSGALTVDNPGVGAEQCYSDAADVLVMFEGTYADYTGWTAPAWELNSTNPDKFWHLIYNTPTQADMENAVSLSKQRNAGYLYVTDGNLPNPWNTLPTGTYWSDELAQSAASGSGGGGTGGGGNCTPVAGSGDITNYSACMNGTTETFTATFNAAAPFHHVFINTDNDQATGFQLPAPSTSPLGADYMIENNTLYQSLSSGWSWAPVTGVSPNMTQNGNTYSWTLPLSALNNPATTQQAEFNGNTFYTNPVTFTQS